MTPFANLLTVAFEAQDAEKNHRRYEVVLGQDLLDDLTVAIRDGRLGHGGRLLRIASAKPDDIRVVIRDRLRQRLFAPKRIGCLYHLAGISVVPGFDAASWLPGEVMARFFAAA